MSVEKLIISLDFENVKIQVGELVQHEKNYFFKFNSNFLDLNLDVSPFKMKRSSGLLQADSQPFDGIFGVFNDSLPDGWGRLLLDRTLLSKRQSLAGITLLDRLAYVGKNGMGALVYEPEETHGWSNTSLIDLDVIYSETVKIVDDTNSEYIENLFEMGGSSGGARPKIFIGYHPKTDEIVQEELILKPEFEHWIVKFPTSTDLPDIANIEHAYYKMAIACGIEMSDSKLFQGKSGKNYFATNRFDREGNSRLHMHSAAGLMHDNFRISAMDYGHLMDCAFKLEKHHDVYEKVFRLAVFNVVFHNRDDHSKNFSFLMNSEGKWNFAPAYDLTFSNSSHGHHSTMIMGESKNPSSKDLLKLANHFGLKSGKEIIDEVLDTAKKWKSIANDSNLSKSTITMIEKKINEFK